MPTSSTDLMKDLLATQQSFNANFENLGVSPIISNSDLSSNIWTVPMIQFLSLSVLIFTFSALVLVSFLLWRQRAQGSHILRVFGVIIIIGMSALLIVVGYSDAQLTPIVGLFGAIAGYLLGKDSNIEKV